MQAGTLKFEGPRLHLFSGGSSRTTACSMRPKLT